MPGTKSSAKKSSVKKSSAKKVVEPTPVKEEVVETVVVESPVVEAEDTNNYDTEFETLQTQLKDALALVKGAMSGLSKLEKRVQRDRKVMDKKMRGRAKRVVDPNKPPSGFAKPGPISDELRAFLKLPEGELIARTEVTKKVTAYCKLHDLQKAEDKRTIQADKTLRTLLRLKKGDELTFFNLQKYMKIHYPNKEGVFSGA
jgi:chromatin remodeling complex protein RSC6